MKLKHISIILAMVTLSIAIILGVNTLVTQKNIELKNNKAIPILMYHHFTNDISKCNDMTITVDKFRQDMEMLLQAGYTTISFEELYDFVATEQTLPKRPIIISIDDGYLSNYEYIYPIMQELNMKATIFVIGKTVGMSQLDGKDITPHFTFTQANEMYNSGLIDIQSHTYNLHDISLRKGLLKLETETNEEYIEMLNSDILKSKNEIEINVGNSVFVLSYPYGLCDNLSLDILKQHNIKITVTTNEGISCVTKNDFNSLYNLQRINVTNDLVGNNLLKKIKEYM